METFDSNFDTSNIIEWPLWDLHRTARILSQAKAENPIPRQREVADTMLGRVAFEMWARRHHDEPQEAILGSETGTPSSQVA
jgi:hypothetical protein